MNFALQTALTCMLCFPAALHAQGVAPADELRAEQEAAVTAQIEASVVRQVLDANGVAVVDDAGEPVLTYASVDDTPVIPGDEIRYVVDIENLGSTASDIEFAFDIPAQGVLIADTITSDWTARFFVTTRDLPLQRTDVFDDAGLISSDYLGLVAGEIEKLYVTVPSLVAGDTGVISYSMMIR